MSDRRTPFELFDEMDRMFDQMRRQMWGGFDRGVNTLREFEYGIDTNLTLNRDEEGYVVLADLPGFEKEEIDLRFDDEILTIHASHEVSEGSEHASYVRSREVDESIHVPGEILVDEIEATYRNGVLEVHLPVEGGMDGDEDDSHRIDID